MLCNTTLNCVDEQVKMDEPGLNKAVESAHNVAEPERHKAEDNLAHDAACQNGVCQIIWKPHRC